MGNYGLYIFCLGGLFIAFPCKFIDIRWCFVPPAKEVKTDGWQAARSFWTPRIAAHSNSTHFRDALILLVSGHLHKRKKKKKRKVLEKRIVAGGKSLDSHAHRRGGDFALLTFNYFRDKQTQTAEGTQQELPREVHSTLYSSIWEFYFYPTTFPFNHFVA